MRSYSATVSIWCGKVLLGALACAGVSAGGCGHNNAPPPVDARRVHAGSGRIIYRVHDDGVAWVQDDTDNRVLWTGPVRRGDTITLNADPAGEGTLSVAGQVKVRENLDAGHSYSIRQKP